MTHYQEIRRENAERRLALGLSGDGTAEGTMNPFCGALVLNAIVDAMTPLVSRVDCPGCTALLILRQLVQGMQTMQATTIRLEGWERTVLLPIEPQARSLLRSLGDAC